MTAYPRVILSGPGKSMNATYRLVLKGEVKGSADFEAEHYTKDAMGEWHWRTSDRSVCDSLMIQLLGQQPSIDGALALISAERRRQIEEEGWSEEHDDEHDDGELAWAAACYAAPDAILRKKCKSNPWPWDAELNKRDDSIQDLVKAGALILAEIDRRQRKEAADEQA